MALAVVQAVGAFAASVSSLTTSNITTTTGNLIHADILADNFNGGDTFSSFADAQGNTFSFAVASFNTGNFQVPDCAQRSKYCANATGKVNNNYTVTLSISGYPEFSVMEISGADTSTPLDLHESAVKTSTGSPSFTTSGTTAVANEIVIGAIGNYAFARSYTNPGGWAQQWNPGTGNGMMQSSLIVSSTGTQTYAPGVNSSNDWSMAITTYKQAAGGGGGQILPFPWSEFTGGMQELSGGFRN